MASSPYVRFPSRAESDLSRGPVLLLDILADIASDTMGGEPLLTALKRQFFEAGRESLDVRSALERRRRRERSMAARVTSNRSK